MIVFCLFRARSLFSTCPLEVLCFSSIRSVLVHLLFRASRSLQVLHFSKSPVIFLYEFQACSQSVPCVSSICICSVLVFYMFHDRPLSSICSVSVFSSFRDSTFLCRDCSVFDPSFSSVPHSLCLLLIFYFNYFRAVFICSAIVLHLFCARPTCSCMFSICTVLELQVLHLFCASTTCSFLFSICTMVELHVLHLFCTRTTCSCLFSICTVLELKVLHLFCARFACSPFVLY